MRFDLAIMLLKLHITGTHLQRRPEGEEQKRMPQIR
jgi:hypothetical protein